MEEIGPPHLETVGPAISISGASVVCIALDGVAARKERKLFRLSLQDSFAVELVPPFSSVAVRLILERDASSISSL